MVLIDGLEGDLNTIDPADVESFSVLKDASATAVYGVRGANGVILITTKRGKEGKLSITARANLTVSQLKRMPNYLGSSKYARLANEAKVLSGGIKLYNDTELELIEDGLDPDLFPNVNWQDEILNPISLQQTYYLNAKSKYANDVAYQKITYRANIDMNLTKSTKLYFGTDGHVTISQTPGGIKNTDKLWQLTREITPLMFPTRYSTGELPTYGAGDDYSPYTMLNETGYSVRTRYRNLMTLALNQDLSALIEGLSAKVQIASDYKTTLDETRALAPAMYKASGRFSDGTLQLAETRKKREVLYARDLTQWRSYQLKAHLNWDRTFGDHNFGSLLYYDMQDIQDTIDANFGYTGSANFPSGEQFGFFPSLALGWAASEYDFVKDNLPWLSFLKFRASYGLTGNDRIAGRTRFPYLQIGAKNLKWEKAIKQNIGVDGKLFKDKISFTVDVYKDTRDNIYQQRRTIPGWAGLITLPYGNVGSMYSYGSDGNIAIKQDISRDMSFTIRANYTYSANHVDYMEEAKQLYPYLEATGYPFGVQRGYIAEGLFKNQEDIETSPIQTFGKYRPGDIKYKDVNGDGIINPYDMVPLTYTNQAPRLMYGVGGEFNYKAFTAGILFKGSGAVEYFRTGTWENGANFDSGWIPFYLGDKGNVLTIVADQENRWTPAWYSGDPSTENPDAMFPRLSYGSNENNSQRSTFWKEDGSFIRLQELSFGYTWAGYEVFKPMGISSVNAQLVMNNLFTIDKVKYFDPEQAKYNGGKYPIPARYSLQLYVNF
ncbi:MAG: SusC/RagA family TonB-linked outer membrane protein [Bacteroidia bacterium]|nr:MAG: SusC/RagA family TonB-linked outer membrane protein [Bacteroidia bacterium]